MNKTLSIACAAALVLAVSGCDSKSSSGGGGGTSGAFSVTGTLPGNVAPSSVDKQTSAVALSSDYVYAVNTAPEYGSAWRKKAVLNDDGSFEIELTKGDPWVIAFIDSTQEGSAMIERIFKADTLDSVAPLSDTTDSSADLGELEVNATNAVLSSGNYNDFIGNLGLSSDEATMLGELDDLMLRYINPDIDGDGTIDLDQSDLPEMKITLWHEYNYGSGLLTNIKAGSDLPTNAAVSYQGAAPELRIEKADSGFYASIPAKWSLEWTNQGDAAVTSATIGDDGTVEFDDEENFGLKVGFGSAITDVPDGTYTYKLYDNEADVTPDKTLTFTHVKTYADASVTENFVFPFPVFNVDGSGDVSSVSYTWMKKTASGFEEATSEELEMIVGKNEAEIKWYTGGGDTDTHATYVTLKPYENDFAVTGSVTLDDGFSGDNFSPARADITHVAISFVSKMGIWAKFSIVD